MEHMQVPIPAGAGPAVLVAIELSKMTWLLAVYDPFTSKVSHRRVDGGDADGLIRYSADPGAILRNEPARLSG